MKLVGVIKILRHFKESWVCKTLNLFSFWYFAIRKYLQSYLITYPPLTMGKYLRKWEYYVCSHEIKRCLLLGRKVMTNRDSIFKSRDITLPTKVHLVKAVVSPVVRYGCESWTVKKAECWRIDAFELWVGEFWESLGLQGDPTSPS